MSQVEKYRLYEAVRQEVIDASSDWTYIDAGDYPYHGVGYNWASLSEDRETVFMKNQGSSVLKIYVANYEIIDSEDDGKLRWQPAPTSKWYLTLPVITGNHFELLDTGVLRKAINTDSPIIMSTSRGEMKFTGTPVLEVDGVDEKVYSVELESDIGWTKTAEIEVKLKLYDIPAPVEADAMLMPVNDAIAWDMSHEIVIFLKDSDAVYFLQVK